MELQWPLIIFTTLVAWSAGLFGTQGVFMLGCKNDIAVQRAQKPALVTSFVLLVAGGIAVFFHLQHWERIFNGFGHVTSGITQELIAIVVLVVVMVLYFVFLHKGEGVVPPWVAVCAIVFSLVLVVVMAHSYMMPARPAWDSFFWIAAVFGEACAFGTISFILIAAFRGSTDSSAMVRFASKTLLAGTAINALTSLAYAIFLQFLPGLFNGVGYYFDSTHPTYAIANIPASVGDQSPLLWIGVFALGALVPLVCAYFIKEKGSRSWKTMGCIVLACILVGAICMRVVFYNLGFGVFIFK